MVLIPALKRGHQVVLGNNVVSLKNSDVAPDCGLSAIAMIPDSGYTADTIGPITASLSATLVVAGLPAFPIILTGRVARQRCIQGRLFNARCCRAIGAW